MRLPVSPVFFFAGGCRAAALLLLYFPCYVHPKGALAKKNVTKADRESAFRRDAFQTHKEGLQTDIFSPAEIFSA
jgi:hypothetical protein